MQLDFSQFLSKLKKLTSIRPIPGTEYVEHYIKAYYLQEAALESWVREHNVSSHKFNFIFRPWINFYLKFDFGNCY